MNSLYAETLQRVLVPDPDVATSDITSPPKRVAFPFVEFKPTKGETYLDIRNLLRAEPEHLPLAFTGTFIDRGVFQVDVIAPDGHGEAPAVRIAELVAARYPIGLELSVPTTRLKIQLLRKPTVAGAIKDGAWVRIPVSIPYTVVN